MHTMIKRLARTPFWLTAAIYCLIVTLFLFGDLFFSGDYRAPSNSDSDLSIYFYPIRAFAFGEMRSGHIPLWNPFVLGGIPALGNFQYALLYPPNWLHLVLPIQLTINLIIAMHVALAGWFTAIWCRRRGSSRVASLLGGTIFMLCGPCIMHVYSGYLTYLCVIAWIPPLFICIDAVLKNNFKSRWVFAGGIVVAMQLLAGYPQIAYFAALGAFCYLVARLINHPRWLTIAISFSMMYALGAMLAAAQLLPGLQSSYESIRGTDVSPAFAMSCSLAPENILSLLTPFLFGDEVRAPVMARWGNTNTCLFIGAVATTLASVAAIRSCFSKDRALVIALVCMLIMAMGEYTPLYRNLMLILPGLGKMRFPARFAVMITVFAAPLASAGYDHLRHRIPRRGAIAVSFVSLTFFTAAILVSRSIDSGRDGLWGRILSRMVATGQTWYKLDTADALSQIQRSARLASDQLMQIAAVFATIALIWFWARTWKSAIGLLFPLALLELVIASVPAWQRFHPDLSPPAQFKAELGSVATDDRILVGRPYHPNMSMLVGVEAINGYDPSVLARWDAIARPLIGSEALSGFLDVRHAVRSTRWPMLRFAHLVPLDAGVQIDPPMPRASLIGTYVVAPGSEESLQTVRRPGFDPRQLVVLENEPATKMVPHTESGEALGMVTTVDRNTDALEIKAELAKPAILLVTDAYSSSWQIETIEKGPQEIYSVMPGDHALRAIPLLAGHHHFILKYWPRSLTAGLIISSASVFGYAIGLTWLWAKRIRSSQTTVRLLPAAFSTNILNNAR